jgi:hypothetical protein
MTQQQTLLIVGVLVSIGVLALAGRARRAVRETGRVMSLFGRTLLVTAGIVAAQWAAWTYSPDIALKLAVLVLPALIAGVAVTRTLTVSSIDHTRRGGGHR